MHVRRLSTIQSNGVASCVESTIVGINNPHSIILSKTISGCRICEANIALAGEEFRIIVFNILKYRFYLFRFI